MRISDWSSDVCSSDLMGISVYDQAPDAETLLMSDNAPMASSDDDVEDEAEAALTTVDSDFGRTTDPVRMYMREMGRSEARRVGKECVSTGRSRWVPYH